MKNAIKAIRWQRPVALRSRWYHQQHTLFMKNSYTLNIHISFIVYITISKITWPKASVQEQLLTRFLCFNGNTFFFLPQCNS